MKKKLQTILCVLCVMLFAGLPVSGCSQEQPTEQKLEKAGKETVQELPIHLEEGWTAGDITANGDTAFYLLVKEEPMAQSMQAVKLCAWDLKSGQENVVYEYASDGFYLNELKAAEDGVFWVRTEGEQQAVERLDPTTGKVKVIEQYGAEEKDILLQSDGKYLTWYCEETASIRGYEIATENLFDVAQQVRVDFPFVRANVIDGICAYAVDQGGKTTIQVYDLAAQKVLQKIPLEGSTALFNIAADRERCLYSYLQEGAMDQRIFVYDYADGKETVVNEDENLYVFSWSYDDGQLFLNERNDNAILVERLDTGARETLSKEGKHLYVLGSTTPDGNYLALDTADEKVPVLTWFQMP